ncbi:unnamed protein product [Leuciscus chuanchicus]
MNRKLDVFTCSSVTGSDETDVLEELRLLQFNVQELLLCCDSRTHSSSAFQRQEHESRLTPARSHTDAPQILINPSSDGVQSLRRHVCGRRRRLSFGERLVVLPRYLSGRQPELECEECVQSSVTCGVFWSGSEVGFFCWSLKVLRLSVTYSRPAGTHTHT